MAHITYNSFIILIFLIKLINLFDVVYSDQKKFISILDEIKSDKEICPFTDNIKQSEHMKICDTVEYPKFNVSLNNTQLLCIGVYNKLIKICVKTSKLNSSKDLPKILFNTTAFDSSIKSVIDSRNATDNKLFKNIKDICATISKPSENSTYDKLKNFTKILEKELGDYCPMFCEFSANLPLCTMMKLIDSSLSAGIKKPIAESIVKETTTKLIAIKIPIDNPQKSEKSGHTSANSSIPKIISAPKSKTDQTTVLNKINSSINNDTKTNPPVTSVEKHVDIKEQKEDKPNDAGKIETTQVEKENKVTISTDIKNSDENQIGMNGEPTDNQDELMEGLEDPQIDREIGVDEQDNRPSINNLKQDDESHFFGYFTIIGFIGIAGCLIYHHKQKILAMLLEGRRARGNRGRRRPSTANYRKLDCTLEEAVTSQCNSNPTHVIY